jgi:hypothetical protein
VAAVLATGAVTAGLATGAVLAAVAVSAVTATFATGARVTVFVVGATLLLTVASGIGLTGVVVVASVSAEAPVAVSKATPATTEATNALRLFLKINALFFIINITRHFKLNQ